MTRCAVLVDRDASVALPELARAAKGRCDLVLVTTGLPEDDPMRVVLRAVGHHLDGPRETWPDLLRAAHVGGVVTFADALLDDADRVVAALGLPGGAVDGAWDKHVQRTTFDRVGASSLGSRLVTSADELDEARRVVGPAGMLKPRRSSTGRGIVPVGDADATGEVWAAADDGYAYVYEGALPWRAARAGLGPFVSVETVSHRSGRTHVAVFDKLPLSGGFVETGDVGPTSLPEAERSAVLDVVDRALDGLAVADRVTHTEVALTRSGPQVIEVNGRLGGYVTGMGRLLGLESDLVAAALDVALGRAVEVGEPDPARVACSVQVPLRTRSEDVARRALEVLRARPGVTPGGLPTPVADDLRPAAAWVGGTDRAAVRATLAEAVLSLQDDPVVRDSLDPTWVADVVAPEAG